MPQTPICAFVLIAVSTCPLPLCRLPGHSLHLLSAAEPPSLFRTSCPSNYLKECMSCFENLLKPLLHSTAALSNRFSKAGSFIYLCCGAELLYHCQIVESLTRVSPPRLSAPPRRLIVFFFERRNRSFTLPLALRGRPSFLIARYGCRRQLSWTT